MSTEPDRSASTGRSAARRLLPWLVVIVLATGLLSAMPGAWALPSQSPDSETVPTLTPTPTRPGATSTPRPGDPTATPDPGQPTDTPAPGTPTATSSPTPAGTLTATPTRPASVLPPGLPADCWAVPTPGFAPQTVDGIALTVESDQFLVVPGQQVTLRYRVANQGADDLADLLVCAPLQAILQRGQVSSSAGEARLVDGGLLFELAELAAGESAQAEVQLTVPSDAPLGGVIENQAWLFGDGVAASSDLLTWALPPAHLPPTGR